MTDAEKRRAAYRWVAGAIDTELARLTHPEWLDCRQEVERMRDDLARAGAVKDDLPELPTYEPSR